MFVIGTAGHVDHGKSSLVRALTGVDPDRLPEEKHRGMTIDLGFASLRLPGGGQASIVDVPGHERFIKNMLAGVGGIDLALLVVAADEGIMPQTREHLDILDLLGVERGLVALTRCDLAESDWVDLVAAEVEELVAGTSLAGAPVVRCSATTREGLPELLAAIEAQSLGMETRLSGGRPRLPIDRVFSVPGFGTVVTGTLTGGSLRVGEDVEVVPFIVAGRPTAVRARVRTLQVHGATVELAGPGARTAVNIAGPDSQQLARGQVLTTPGWLQPSLALDVCLRALPSLGKPLRHNLQVTFHTYAAETPAVLRLLEGDPLAPGEAAWAQLRLRNPVAAATGDRFVLRDANGTIGGGVIAVTQAPRRQRRHAPTIALFDRLTSGDPAERLFATLADAEPAALEAAAARCGLTGPVAENALDALERSGRVTPLGKGAERTVWTTAGLAELGRRVTATVTELLAQSPLRTGVNREELRGRLKLAPRTFEQALYAWTAEGVLEQRGSVIATAGWRPVPSVAQQAVIDRFLAELRAAPFTLAVAPADGGITAYLTERGDIIDPGGGVVADSDDFRDAAERAVALIAERGAVTLADVRDELGSSRRYAQALLEHLDRQKVTVRRGDVRTLAGAPAVSQLP